MQVEKRLKINVAVSVITAFIIALMLFLTLSRVNRATTESEVASEILSSAFERSTFRSDYLRTSSERARVQWLAKSDQVGRLLKFAADRFKDADDKITIDEMIRDHASTVKLFSDIVENREKRKSGKVSAALSEEIEQRLVTQLNMRLYEKVLHTGRLRESAGTHLLSALRLAGWSIFFVIAIVAAAATANSLTLGRTIINRIRLLQDGASIIGQGNLDHRIEIKGDDEFADLSKAFNAMTVKLSGSYLSLEKEIAERKRNEEALRESEERYRGLFENMIEGYAYCKMIFENGKPQDFIYLSVNHAFETLTGLKNVAGKRATEVIPGIREADPELFEIYGRVSLTGKPESFEIFIEALKMWFSISVYSPGKEFFVAVFDVITNRKQAEKEINELNKELTLNVHELESSNKELEAFIYSVAHDLRAPLRSISGFSDFLLKRYSDKVDEKGKKHLNRIIDGAEQMNKIIDDLLHLSRISRHEMHKENVDMGRMAKSLVAELRATQPGRRVAIDIQEGLAGFADPGLMKVALSNLLNNAWKFTSKTDNARIEFGVLDRAGKTVYYIKDNGAGFDQAFAERIFLPFHRLHTEQEFEGTGIGLAIVERVLRRHGGNIWAEGRINEGAVFFFTLS